VEPTIEAAVMRNSRIRRRHYFIPPLALVQLLTIGCFPEVKPPLITGTFTLKDHQSYGDENSCQGDGGYSDIKDGTPVVVYNQNNRIIGSGKLSQSKKQQGGNCVFFLSVSTTSPATFYQIEVGRRGKLPYSAKQLKDDSYSVFLGFD
jgi:hypothetical protein